MEDIIIVSFPPLPSLARTSMTIRQAVTQKTLFTWSACVTTLFTFGHRTIVSVFSLQYYEYGFHTGAFF